jgi:hypothetical protein
MNIGELAKFRGGVSVDTISELTSASGVTIDSVLLKDGNVTASASGTVTTTYIQAADAQGLSFKENGGTEVLAVSDAGAVTVGPNSGFTVTHTANGSLKILRGTVSGNTDVLAVKDQTDNTTLFAVQTAGQIFAKTTSWGTGGTAIGVSGGLFTTSPSSRRYKENESSLTIDSSKIYDIEIKEFDYIESKGGAHDFGAIAEDVDAILPQIVWKEDGIPESIRESKLVWLIIAEMKKLHSELQVAKDRIATLEGG